MTKNGPIIILDDDPDDRDILGEVFKNLNIDNEIIFFADGNTALEYINKKEVKPFLILSDINMPRINGFELRNLIHTNEQLHIKCIPYLFITTKADKQSVIDAYSMSVQGFFTKPSNFKDLESTIKKIVEYWKECIAPNHYP